MSDSSSTSSRFELGHAAALLLVAVLGSAMAVRGLLAHPKDLSLWAGLVLVLGLTLWGWLDLRKEQHLLSRIDEVLDAASKGELEPRITQIPEQGRLVEAAWRLNETLDQIEAVFRESITVVTRIGEGDFGRQPQTSGLHGIYPQVLVRMAAVQQNMASTVDMLGQAMRAMAQGDFSVRQSTEGLKGQYLAILNDTHTAVHALDLLISDVVHVMEKVSRGELGHRVQAQGAGALAKLKDDINRSLQSLGDSMSQIGENAHHVAGAAGESSTAIGQLADGAQSQTQYIGQMVTAIRQTSAAINDISSNTELASRQAQESTQIVRDGQGKMVQMVDVVNSIASSSEKINKITDVIEKIANKTNLLSLNAAIEAARAGEHGKGFAVVADEVGKLASSSAESTKEITQLIQQAAQQASHAVVAVREVSADMERIVKSAIQTDGMLQRISAAVEQQSRMVLEINGNVESLETIARSNSSAYEELATAMIELSKVADSTRREIAKFST